MPDTYAHSTTSFQRQTAGAMEHILSSSLQSDQFS